MKSLILALSMMLITALIVLPLPDAKASPPPEDVTTACGPPCVLALLALGIGAVVVVSLVGFCKKHIPQDNPAPPPHHSQSDEDTNTIPILPIPIGPILTLVSTNIDYSDISANGWTDEHSNLFALYFEATLVCSSNNVNWDREIPLHAYLGFATVNGMPDYTRPTNSIVVGFNPQGQPMFTNFWPKVTRIYDTAEQQYFRLRIP